MTLPTEFRGIGTLTIGTRHVTDVHYRIFVREDASGAKQAAGVIAAAQMVLWEAFAADPLTLALEDGTVLDVVVNLYSGGDIADIHVRGPAPESSG